MRHMGGSALALVVLLASCGSDTPPVEALPTPETPGDEDPLAGQGPPAPPPPDPGVSGKPVEGVFVSSSKGFEDGDGAMARPVKTLKAAFELARDRDLPVIACAERYEEAVTLLDGVTAYGFYDCSSSEWKRADARARIESPTVPALKAEGLTRNARFEGFEILPAELPPRDPEAPPESSIGVWIKGTKGLRLAELLIKAGDAHDGTDGTPGPANEELSTSVAQGPEGQSGGGFEPPCGIGQLPPCSDTVPGRRGSTSQCKVGANGGPGGAGGVGSKYFNGVKQTPFNTDHAGKTRPATSATALGGASPDGAGASGAPGAPGSLGANGSWHFTSDGFVLVPAKAGGMGAPGQGGGGGGSRPNWVPTCSTFDINGKCILEDPMPDKAAYTGRGGGGGAGGCGGVPGTVGTGGGGSFGLIVIDSDISISKTRITTGKGGRAGKAGAGSDGTPGRPRGTSGSGEHSGGPGGDGGAGGPAGLSGSGSAGPSIALVYHGKRPAMVDVELVPGPGGEGVPAITKGTQTLPAVVGESKQEHAF